MPTSTNINFGFSQQNQDSAAATPPFKFGSSQTPQANGTSSAVPPPFQFGSTATPQTNGGGGGGGMFGSNSTIFGATFGQKPNTSQPPQQNGFNPSTTFFGSQANTTNNTSATSFGGFGQSNPTQPQQNGLTPTTTSSFPSFDQQNGEKSFPSFGQSQQQQNTQSTSATSFGGFGQQNSGQAQTSTSFHSLAGQSSQQSNGDKSPFGSTSHAEQTSRPSTGSLFTGLGQHDQNQNLQNGVLAPPPSKSNSTGDLFSGLSRPENSKDASGPVLNPPKPGESLFSNLPQPTVKQGMFTSGADNKSKPTSSSLISGAFGQQPQQDGKQVSSDGDRTPKTNSIFSGLPEPNGIRQGMFTTSSASQPEQPASPTQKPTGGLFSGGFGQGSQQQSNTSAFAPGQSQGDTNMSSDKTPEKSRLASGNSQQATATEAPSARAPVERSTNEGKSLFERISRDPPAAPSKSLLAPSRSLLGQSASTGKSLFERPPSRDRPGTSTQSMYQGPIHNRYASAAAETSATNDGNNGPMPPSASQSSAQTTSNAPSAATTVSMNDTISDGERYTFKFLNEGLMAHMTMQDPTLDWSTILEYYLKQAAQIRKKPEPKFDAHVQAPAPSVPSAPASGHASQDSSSQAVHALSNTRFAPAGGSAPPWNAPLPDDHTLSGSSNAPKAPDQSLPSNADPHRPAPTAPLSRKRHASDEDDDEQRGSPAEKRRRADEPPVEYPKLPDNASETAKRFQAALDRPSSRSGKSDFPRSLADSLQRRSDQKDTEEREARQEKERKESEELMEREGGARVIKKAFGEPTVKEKEPSAFTPAPYNSMQAMTARALGQPLPAAPPPSFTFPQDGNSFMSAFGKRANEEEDKARSKRKLDDFDSDEDTEEAWAERDKAEQEAKRQKILDAAKSAKGFVPSGTNTPTDDGEGEEENASESPETQKEKEPEMPMGAGKSLFERISRDPPTTAPSKPSDFASQTPDLSKGSTTTGLFGSKTPAPTSNGSSMTSSIFGNLSKTTQNLDKGKSDAEKEQGSGDNTWKPSTPIKFGEGSTTGTESATPAEAPPTVARLFGSNLQKPSTDSSGHLIVPKPTSALQFGFGGQPASLGTSRATTPGVTTDGEGASTAGEGENEPGEETTQTEPQVEDQTALRPDEHEGEDLLLSTDIAKASKWGETRNEDTNAVGFDWVDKGKGPLYILKHRDNGKMRIVLKVPPYGTPKMNFAPVKGADYVIWGKSGKAVKATFMDHLEKKDVESGKPSLWKVQVREAEQAEQIAELLMEGRPE